MSQLATARSALAILGCAGFAVACSSRSFSLGTIYTSDAGTDTATDVRVAAGPTTPWIATIPGLLNQSVHGLAVNAANELFLTGDSQFPPEDEFNVDAFASSFNATDGVKRWTQAIDGRNKGWADNGIAVIPAAGDVIVVGTFRVGAVDPLGFADVYPSTGGAPKSTATLFARTSCTPQDAPCDAPFSHEAQAATLAGNALFVAGSAKEQTGSALPWLVQPAPLDASGWGFVGAMQGSTPLWARTLGDRFIRVATSVLVSGNELYVAAIGSVSAASDDADSPPRLWLMKFDLAGNLVQERFYQTSQGFGSPRLVLTPRGLVVAAAFSGTFDAAGKALVSVGPADICVLGVNNGDLSLRWASTLGGDLADDWGHAVVAMPNGDVVLACGSCVNPDGVGPSTGESSRPGMVRLGADGIFRASVAWETNGHVHVDAAIANNKGDGILVAGAFTGRLDATGLSATATDGEDGFVLQVLPP